MLPGRLLARSYAWSGDDSCLIRPTSPMSVGEEKEVRSHGVSISQRGLWTCSTLGWERESWAFKVEVMVSVDTGGKAIMSTP